MPSVIMHICVHVHLHKIGISEVATIQNLIDGTRRVIDVEKMIISGSSLGEIEGLYELKGGEEEEVEMLVVNIKGEIEGTQDQDVDVDNSC